MSYQNSFSQLSRNRKGRKCRKRQSTGPLKLIGEGPPLHLLSFCQFASNLWLILVYSFIILISAFVITWYSPRLCARLYVCTWLSSYMNTDHIGLGFILLQYDLILTNYSIFCDSPISKYCLILRSWKLGLQDSILRGDIINPWHLI